MRRIVFLVTLCVSWIPSAVGVYYQWDKQRMTKKQIKRDIAELDVGDLDDMTADVPPMFKDMLTEKKMKKLSAEEIQQADDPMAAAMGQQVKMKMVFAVLNHDMMVEQHGKNGGDVMAQRWKEMLTNGGVTVNSYSVSPTRILFTTGGPGVFPELKKFVLDQPETDWFEVDQKKYYPKGRTKEIMDNDERKKREIALGWEKEREEPEKKEKKKKKKKKSKKQEDEL